MKHRLAAAGLVLGVAGGAAAGLALGVPGLASAQSDVTTTAPASPTTTVAGGGSSTTPSRSSRLSEILAPLVSNGTITQAQADAVIAAIDAAKPTGMGRHGPGRGIGASLEAAATALGITEDELHDALESGKTIADVAKEKGVDVQKVIDALVVDAKTRLAQAVTDGKITQAEADERLADLEERVTDKVNSQLPTRGGRGHHGDDQDSTTTTTAPSS